MINSGAPVLPAIAFSTDTIGLTWRTVRHLRPHQALARVLFRLARPRTNTSPAPSISEPSGAWVAPVTKPRDSYDGNGFRFLNRTECPVFPRGWNDPSLPKLWLYNLHYFDGLADACGTQNGEPYRRLIARWIADNPPVRGNGWEPYPLSLRIVNWIKWHLGPGDLSDTARQSLAVQVRFLRKRIEWHLMANHLFANAKALVFAGCFFDGDEARGWRQAGLAILQRQLPEQVLADGGHFERSPMYHAIILADLLDLINLARTYPDALPRPIVEGWQNTAQRMLRWMASMIHPDGQIGFFNDAAFDIAMEPCEIDAYARDLGMPGMPAPSNIVDLAESGYARGAAGPFTVFIDAAPVGPDYQPGHAHADTLSFELSFEDERVVVNGGTSTYEVGDLRARERSTSAHSTIEIDGENSSEVWAGFRVGRRAEVTHRRVWSDGAVHSVSAAHTGYRHLPGQPVHRRRWDVAPGSVRIDDEITGHYGNAVARFHLHPDIRVDIADDLCSGCLATAGGRRIAFEASAPVQLEPSQWAPEFGRQIATHALAADITAGRFTLALSPA